jgi:hypothetical protein
LRDPKNTAIAKARNQRVATNASAEKSIAEKSRLPGPTSRRKRTLHNGLRRVNVAQLLATNDLAKPPPPQSKTAESASTTLRASGVRGRAGRRRAIGYDSLSRLPRTLLLIDFGEPCYFTGLTFA